MERLTEEMQIGPFASLKDKAEAKPGVFADYDCLYAHMMAVTRLKQYEDTRLSPEEITKLISPPNPPLTLEELREMDGEPVWILSIDGEYDPCWVLINTLDERVYDANDGFCPFREYSKTWLAYRRKPEEGTT